MKALELHQMEQIEGGKCTREHIAMGLAITAGFLAVTGGLGGVLLAGGSMMLAGDTYLRCIEN